jgi:cytoskeletal protein CcmA (bactofilin family)
MSRLRSNKVVNQAGSGAPELTYGAVIPNTGTISGAGKVSIGGSITAGSFHGDGSGLSGVGDPSAIKSGSDVKVQAISTGANVTGNLAATGNVTAVDGTFSGNATVQGNLTVNGTTTTIDTAVTSVDSLAVDGQITSLGNLGIGTATPTSDVSIFGVSPKIFLKDTTVGQAGVGSAYLHNNLTQSRFEIGINDYRCIHLNTGGDVVLSYGNSGKFVTTNTGIRVVGDALIDGNSTMNGTGSLKVPVGTTAQRPTPAAGMFRYNTTEGKFEGYTTEWGEIGGGGGITTEAHVANNAVVTLDLTAAVDHKVTATGICTITCTGGTEAQSHTIRIINSGSATVGFSTYFLFPSGNTPVLTSTDGAINLISFTVNRVGAAGTQLLAGASLNFS